MRTLGSVACVMLLMSLAAGSALAKRAAPKEVPPVTLNGIVYSAPHDHMGCVVARSEKTQQLAWMKQIYVVKYDLELETDVQDCFITELKVAGNTLTVRSERDGEYELDLTTLAMKVVKGSEVVQKK